MMVLATFNIWDPIGRGEEDRLMKTLSCRLIKILSEQPSGKWFLNPFPQLIVSYNLIFPLKCPVAASQSSSASDLKTCGIALSHSSPKTAGGNHDNVMVRDIIEASLGNAY